MSFLIPAAVVFAVVIFGYFRDCLPGDHLSLLDRAFLQRWHWCRGCRQRNRATFDASSNHPVPQCSHGNDEVDSRRRKGLETFILSLGDQQLITGPAMIVAALIQQCNISLYEFQVVNSLALLSSTTHLISLNVLHTYFRENPMVRNVRVVGMLINFGLLMTTVVFSAPNSHIATSIGLQCIIDFWKSSLLGLQIVAVALFFPSTTWKH